jgi:hypothetical protein
MTPLLGGVIAGLPGSPQSDGDFLFVMIIKFEVYTPPESYFCNGVFLSMPED